MRRKILTLCLTVAAAFALTALSAAAASAAPLFHAESEPVTFKGSSSDNTFVTKSGTVECANSSFAGTSASKTTSTATLAPTYGECTAFGFLGAKVEPHGCKYTFHLVEGSSPPTATVDVVCEGSNEITIESTGCVVHVPPQTGLKHVVFENLGAGKTRTIKAGVTVEGITYTATSGCINAGTWTTGKYSGTVTISGTNAGGTQQGIWVE
ncbi:MAG TPA: hypothetical protein VMF55_16470 [Solirubrobacterales bacterium]|nr:hypothetical protein [Solirubrobacterales bacterium]